jgi:hypothetical protein
MERAECFDWPLATLEMKRKNGETTMQDDDHGDHSLPEDWCRRWVSSVRDYAVIGLSRDGTIRTWNVGGEQIHGFASEEVIGRHFDMFHTPAARAQGAAAAALETARRTGRSDSEAGASGGTARASGPAS